MQIVEIEKNICFKRCSILDYKFIVPNSKNILVCNKNL